MQSTEAVGFLSESQKRGVARLCACLLPAVTDGSTDILWSRTYLKLLVEKFLKLSSTQTEAFLPILMSRQLRLAEKTRTPSRGTSTFVDDLDPAPFLAQVIPKKATDTTRRSRAWTKLTTLKMHQSEARKQLTIQSQVTHWTSPTCASFDFKWSRSCWGLRSRAWVTMLEPGRY